MNPKNQETSTAVATARSNVTDEEIRDYAYHLYVQSGCQPGHDIDNWLEAKACLEANIPKQHARTRLHRHRNPTAEEPEAVGFVAFATAQNPFSPVPDAGEIVLEEIVVATIPDKPRR